ncbi:MAG: hypothetical protein Q9227_003369 [Pyrenula ochraceoflavens]
MPSSPINRLSKPKPEAPLSSTPKTNTTTTTMPKVFPRTAAWQALSLQLSRILDREARLRYAMHFYRGRIEAERQEQAERVQRQKTDLEAQVRKARALRKKTRARKREDDEEEERNRQGVEMRGVDIDAVAAKIMASGKAATKGEVMMKESGKEVQARRGRTRTRLQNRAKHDNGDYEKMVTRDMWDSSNGNEEGKGASCRGTRHLRSRRLVEVEPVVDLTGDSDW